MKKTVLVLGLAIFLIQCGGGKEAVNEDVILEQIASDDTAVPNAESPAIQQPVGLQDTLNTVEVSLADSIASAEIIQPEKIEIPDEIPQFNFYFSSGAEFDIASGDSLKFVVDGADSALVFIRFLNKEGDAHKFFTGKKDNFQHSYALSNNEVSQEVGVGIHEFIAEVQYDPEKSPVEIRKSIIIFNKADQVKKEEAAPVATEKSAVVAVKEIKVIKTEPVKKSTPQTMPSVLSELAFDDIFFDYGVWKTPSLSFNSNYIITLGKVVKAVKLDPQLYVILSGHTDTKGSDAYNQDLAIRRTSTIARLICEMFKEDERPVIAQRIILTSAGASQLLFESDNQMKEALNRRVSLKIDMQPQTGLTYAEYLQQEQKPIVVAAPKPETKPAPVAIKKKKSVSAEEQIYNKAYDLYAKGSFTDASALFEEIISLNPKHSLADNAAWWIAEMNYQKKNYSAALTGFQKVFALGDGNKNAYARLRMGYCYYHLGEKEKSAQQFKQVVQDYPKNAEEVRKARIMLEQIQK